MHLVPADLFTDGRHDMSGFLPKGDFTHYAVGRFSTGNAKKNTPEDGRWGQDAYDTIMAFTRKVDGVRTRIFNADVRSKMCGDDEYHPMRPVGADFLKAVIVVGVNL